MVCGPTLQAMEAAGFDGYVAFGCMGEFYAPSDEEWKKFVDVATDATKKIASVFGTTFQNTAECIRRTKYAEDAGADGVMIGPPYVVPATFEAALDHFRRVNDSVDEIQIMAYNNPGSFRFNMTPEFWDELMKLDRIKAVKESNGEVVHRTRSCGENLQANERIPRRRKLVARRLAPGGKRDRISRWPGDATGHLRFLQRVYEAGSKNSRPVPS